MKFIDRALSTLNHAPAATRAALLSVAALAALSFSQQAAAQAATYEITFTNLTSAAQNTGAPTAQTGQRLSPPVFVTHSGAYNLYGLGQTATEAVWRIAESGDRSVLLNEVNALVGSSVLSVVAPLAAPLPQQESVTVKVQTDASHHWLSFASMLGWTNDGFLGVSGLDLSAITGSFTLNLFGYDAGSEKNSEANGFLGALGSGNARDPESGVITQHLGKGALCLHQIGLGINTGMTLFEVDQLLPDVLRMGFGFAIAAVIAKATAEEDRPIFDQ